MLFAISCWTFIRVFFGASATVALENIALRHQLVVLQRSVSRPRFKDEPSTPRSDALAAAGFDEAVLQAIRGTRGEPGVEVSR